MPIGECRLCKLEKPLLKSHYMPAALYGKKGKEFEFCTKTTATRSKDQVKEYLLCQDCERRFADNGETHVLNAIAGKSMKRFPLSDVVKEASARDADPTTPQFCADDLGLDVEKLAYFALSIVWRGTVHQWTKFDGTLTELLPFGPFEETIRSYLLDQAGFPSNASVIVIVCSDTASREIFYIPSAFEEPGLEASVNCRFVARGIIFRCVFGEFSAELHEACCRALQKPIFYSDCERRTLQDFPKVPLSN